MLENMLKNINDYLKDNEGAILLHPKNKSELFTIKSYIIDLNLPISFLDLSNDEELSILLRYSPYVEKFNILNKAREASMFFKRKDFTAALNCYKELLKVGVPNGMLYLKIALVYLKLSNINEAINYLEIALLLEKLDNKDTEYIEDMLNRLKLVQGKFDNKEFNDYLESLASCAVDQLYDNKTPIDLFLKNEEVGIFKLYFAQYSDIILECTQDINGAYLTLSRQKNVK